MIPDYCEALTAYRAFDVFPNGLLAGQAVTEPWPPFAPFVARCAAVTGQGHLAHVQDGAFVPAPVYRCDCGIHALKAESKAEARVIDDRIGSWWSSQERPEGRAWGAVKVWGRVIEHADGYRAEFAYPSSLCCDDADLAPKIAALYGIPCAFKAITVPPPKSLDISGIFRIPSVYSVPSSYRVIAVDWAVKPTPSNVAPPPPRTVQPHIVGANRWQVRQHAKHTQGRPSTDWRGILRDMVHA